MSIEIVNSLINFMNFDFNISKKYNDIIDNIHFSNNKYSIKISNPPKKVRKRRNPNEIGNSNKNINIIYYNEDIKHDAYSDSILFERMISNGILILATDETRFKFILDEIQRTKKDKKEEYDFYLIVSGSTCEKIMNYLGNNAKDFFVSRYIFTGEYEKYENYTNNYDLIEGVYTEFIDIFKFIED